MKLTKEELQENAYKLGFSLGFTERAMMLGNVLYEITQNEFLSNSLALKGGSVLNLCIFNIARLSNDIDFDLCIDISEDELPVLREKIRSNIKDIFNCIFKIEVSKYMGEHYDSFILKYNKLYDENDCIIIDINYKKRIHILDYEFKKIKNSLMSEMTVLTVNHLEVYGGKIKVLLERFNLKDFFDINNMIIFHSISSIETDMLRKIVIFYNVLSGRNDLENFSRLEAIKFCESQLLEFKKLLPSYKDLDIDKIILNVNFFINTLMVLTEEEKYFIQLFHNKKFKPQLIFNDETIINKLLRHPLVKI